MNKRSVSLTTDLATYTVTETVDEDGSMRILLEMSNPPQGLGPSIYEWNGRKSALVPLETERIRGRTR